MTATVPATTLPRYKLVPAEDRPICKGCVFSHCGDRFPDGHLPLCWVHAPQKGKTHIMIFKEVK